MTERRRERPSTTGAETIDPPGPRELRVALIVAGNRPAARLREHLFAIGDAVVTWQGTLQEFGPTVAGAADLVVADIASLAVDISGFVAATSAIWKGPAIAVLPANELARERVPPAGDGARLVACTGTLEGLREALVSARRDLEGLGLSPASGIEKPLVEWLVGTSRDRGVHQAPVREVLWIEAFHNHVTVHTPHGSFVLRRGISAMAEALAPALFVRIHRSFIVNRGAIASLGSNRGGSVRVTLTDGTHLPVGRPFRSDVSGVISARRSA